MSRTRLHCLNHICQLSLLALLFALAIAYSIPAHAQTYGVIHYFGNGTDGAQPNGAIYKDSSGNVYGATRSGGTLGGGVIYQISVSGVETTLHNLAPNFRGSPNAGLSLFNGTWLFGVASSGGTKTDGSVFAQQLSPPAFKNVHSFSGPDGAGPVGTLVLSADGSTAYGVTAGGGAHNAGEVYKVDKSGNVTVIYSFSGGADGDRPSAGLLLDSAGNLYGTTMLGGATQNGVLFRIDPSGTETLLHNFANQTGSNPDSTPLADGLGNVYGTASSGGSADRGVLYKLNLSTGDYTIVHTFIGADGASPTGDLVKDGSGHLYGVTASGGDPHCGCGVVYRMDVAGNETVLHIFRHDGEGEIPNWVYRDSATGFLYGTTQSGGAFSQGALFRMTP